MPEALQEGKTVRDLSCIRKLPKPEQDEVLDKLGIIVSDICAIALIYQQGVADESQPLLCYESCRIYNRYMQIALLSSFDVSDNEINTIEPPYYPEDTLHLLGCTEDISSEPYGWIALSFRGQVILPEIVLGRDIREKGYLKLACIPGVLRIGQRGFSCVQSTCRHRPAEPPSYTGPWPGEVSALINCHTDSQMKWHTVQGETTLEANMIWTSDPRIEFELSSALRCLEHACHLGHAGMTWRQYVGRRKSSCYHHPRLHKDTNAWIPYGQRYAQFTVPRAYGCLL